MSTTANELLEEKEDLSEPFYASLSEDARLRLRSGRDSRFRTFEASTAIMCTTSTSWVAKITQMQRSQKASGESEGW
jgi:hypothetical protein